MAIRKEKKSPLPDHRSSPEPMTESEMAMDTSLDAAAAGTPGTNSTSTATATGTEIFSAARLLFPEVHPEEAWQKVVTSHPEKVALWKPDGAAWATFAEIDDRAEAWARQWRRALLQGEGAGPGLFSAPVVAVALPSGPAWIAALLALWKMGAIPLLLSADTPGSIHKRLEELGGACARLQTGPAPDEATGTASTHDPLTTPPAWCPLPCRPNQALQSVSQRWHLLKSTSGTTGHPRLLGFTATALWADAAQILADMQFGPEDRCFGSIPLSHSYGFSNLVTPLVFFGVPLVCGFDPMPRALAEGLTHSQATVWPAVPALLPGLLQTGFAGTRHLRCTLSAGALLPSAVAKDYARATGRPVHAFYGSSECGGICYDAEGRAAEIEGFVGRPMRHIGCRLLPGVEGTHCLEISGPTLTAGVFPREEDEAWREGRFYPSDLLEKAGGGFRILGRMDDMVNVGGRKVHPAAIERLLATIPGVRGVVVFGLPSTQSGRGEQLAAWIEADASWTTETMAAAAANFLPDWQRPREWQICDKLPYNERGKISRKTLAQAWPALPD